MQFTSTATQIDKPYSLSCIDINAASVLLGLSIVNKAKLQLKEPLSAAKLTMNQWLVLKILYLKRADTPSHVAKTIDADPTTISRHLDSLEKRGLISRKNDSDDRRVVQLQITHEGELIAKQIYQRYSGILQNLDPYLTENQQAIWKKIEEYVLNHIDESNN